MSTFRRLLPLLAVALLAAALAGCGGGAGNDKPATRTITDADLAAMVLTKADLGQEFAGFQESGAPDTNDDRVQASDDPENERKDQQTFGRTTGYNRKLTATPATLSAGGPILIEMGATLFGDGAGAAGSLDDDLQDVQSRVGRTDLGMSLESAETFPVPTLGDQSLGLRTQASEPPDQGGTETVYVTYFWFRRDRIIGDVAIVRADDTDASQQAQTIATLLDERIQQILSQPATATPPTSP